MREDFDLSDKEYVSTKKYLKEIQIQNELILDYLLKIEELNKSTLEEAQRCIAHINTLLLR